MVPTSYDIHLAWRRCHLVMTARSFGVRPDGTIGIGDVLRLAYESSEVTRCVTLGQTLSAAYVLGSVDYGLFLDGELRRSPMTLSDYVRL